MPEKWHTLSARPGETPGGSAGATRRELVPYPPFAGAIGYGNIIGIADATRFHLRSAHQILTTLFPDQPDFLKDLDEILQRLEFGLPSAALLLTTAPVRLTRAQCLALLSVGLHNADDLKNLNDDRLRHCVESGTAALLRPKSDMAGAMLGEQGGDK